MRKLAGAIAGAMLWVSCASAQTITAVAEAPARLTALPSQVNGRVQQTGTPARPMYERQWPGTYAETAIEGDSLLLEVGPGEVHLKVRVDDRAPVPMMKPMPGFYRIGDLGPGAHRVRVDVVSEGQGAPTSLGGFYADAGTRALPLPPRKRQIEFIGDSLTVGYGNTSATRDCSAADVWATTDTSQGIAPRVARHFEADYQVNAISGRGIVRNYGGAAADTVPQAYPFTLFDKAARNEDPSWSPELIVIGLGTNDFSTSLKAGERWKTREALRADFEATYIGFVQQLRARYPHASFLLWATNGAEGEIATAVVRVAARLDAAGDRRISMLRIDDIAMSGCNYHPNVAEDDMMARMIIGTIESKPEPFAGS